MLANDSKAKKHYRIPAENANSVCLQTARTPKNIIESLPKGETKQLQEPKFTIEMTPKEPPKKAQGSPKRFFLYFFSQTLKGHRPKNDPRENPENELNEYRIPTKCLKRIIRYETPAKL